MRQEIGRVYKITNEASKRNEATYYVCMGIVDALHGDFVDEYYADAYNIRWDHLEEADIKKVDEDILETLIMRVFGDAG